MGIAGFVLALIGGFFGLIGLIPLLGWLNWFTTLPFSFSGIVLSIISVATGRRRGLGVAGLIIGALVFVIAIFRLILGGGIL